MDVRSAKGETRRIETDLLAVAGGWNPSIGLGSNLGDRPVWSEAIQAFVMATPSPAMIPIGAAAGHFSLREALTDGVRSAEAIARDLGRTVPKSAIPRTTEDASEVKPLWHVGAHKAKAFVDFQNDVTDADVRLAAQEGFVSIEHLKRYTTLGMATDQGKTSQLNGHALLAAATGRSIAETGTILSRPPYTPVAIGAFAGHHRDQDFRPERRTASHQWAIEQGATFVDTGLWKRAQWFARPGERDWLETVNREVTMTRNGVGICDVSTLGKIDVHGPDAGRLLDRLYINTFSTLPIGKARYGIMLREDGFVMDDGTTTRFAEDRFFVTTTTANAAKVMQHIDYARQVLWPELDVQATSVDRTMVDLFRRRTALASTAAEAPAHARPVERWLPATWPPSNCAGRTYPRGCSASPSRANSPTRSACRRRMANSSIRALFEVGKDFDAIPYGTEALGVMRIEKGHPAGNELNGQTTAGDLGMGRMMSTKKDFIGRVMAGRPGLTDPDRPSLVGIRPLGGERLRAGATPDTTRRSGDSGQRSWLRHLRGLFADPWPPDWPCAAEARPESYRRARRRPRSRARARCRG